MKIFCRNRLAIRIVPALVLLAVPALAVPAPAENVAAPAEKNAPAALPKLPFDNVVGEFRQTKTFRDVGVSVRSFGTFYVRKNRELFWNTLRPAKIGFLLSDEGAFQLIDGKKTPLPDSARPTMQTLHAVFDAALAGNESELARVFKISRNSENAWTLVPLAAPLASFVKKIEIRANGNLLESVKINDASDDETLIEFFNVADGGNGENLKP